MDLLNQKSLDRGGIIVVVFMDDKETFRSLLPLTNNGMPGFPLSRWPLPFTIPIPISIPIPIPMGGPPSTSYRPTISTPFDGSGGVLWFTRVGERLAVSLRELLRLDLRPQGELRSYKDWTLLRAGSTGETIRSGQDHTPSHRDSEDGDGEGDLRGGGYGRCVGP